MSRLSFIGRPWVVFDAADKQHREWFMDFNRRRTWAYCPVRFIVSDEVGDLLTMIQRKLLAYYSAQEFGEIDACLDMAIAA